MHRTILVLVWLSCMAPAMAAPQAEPAAAQTPLFRFGLIADVQYADKAAAGRRRYAASGELLKAAVADLNTQELAFVANLGDLVDGNGARTREEMERMLGLLRESKAPLRNVVGNHCLVVPRPKLLEALGLPAAYYAFDQAGWRFLVLDGMDVSRSGPTGDEEARKAREYLANDPKLPTYNGALGDAQMAWLRAQLAAAAQAGRRVIVFCHHPAAGDRSHALWNGSEVVKTLEEAGCVAAYICGHDHRGGYVERNGIHYVTVQGMVEAPEGSTAYAVVDVFPDRLVIAGKGTVPSRVLVVK